MQKVSQADIDNLVESPHKKVISLYIPTHRHPTPPHMTEDQIRFKNLLHQAAALVKKDDDHDIALMENLHELEKKLDDLDFWQQTIESLAIFVSPDEIMVYHLPIESEEFVSYADSFEVAPLIVTKSYDQQFYVLSLAMHDSKVFEGDMYGMKQLDITLPSSVEDALHIDEMFINSRTKRSHQGGGAGGPNAQTSPHGEGDSSEAGRQERLQYFRIIEELLQKHLDMKQPIIVAGTENEVGDFCAHTKLQNLTESSLRGNYSHLSAGELHSLVWPHIYQDVVRHKEQDAIEKVRELQGANRASTKISDIEHAASDGRIETLLVPMIDQTHDSISDTTTEVPIMRMNTDADESSRLKRIVQAVHEFGGHVLGIDSDAMPNHSRVAAVYRY